MSQIHKGHSTGIIREQEQVACQLQRRRQKLQSDKTQDHILLNRTFARLFNTGMDITEKLRDGFDKVIPYRPVTDSPEHAKIERNGIGTNTGTEQVGLKLFQKRRVDLVQPEFAATPEMHKGIQRTLVMPGRFILALPLQHTDLFLHIFCQVGYRKTFLTRLHYFIRSKGTLFLLQIDYGPDCPAIAGKLLTNGIQFF